MANPAPTAPIGHGLGHGGNTSGMPWDPSEFTPELAWPLSISVYDKMRRQDAQTKGVLNAVTLPIRRANWRLDPNDAPDNVVAAIAADLGLDANGPVNRRRRRQRFDWTDHTRLALLALPYGHSIFEKVGEIGADGLWHLTRLEERLPATIAKINVARNGDLLGVEQYPSGLVGDTGIGLPMPADRLVFYSHEREGGLWQGQSILRSSYKNWLLKDRLIRADTMKHERNGMGVPIAEAPEHATDKAIERMHDVVTRWRAGEVSGAAVPPGWKIRLVGVEGTLPDTLASVRYHDEQIAQETLAMFMKLGSSATGSRALGEEFIDLFMLSLQTVADELANTFNEQQIEMWVDWNWGEDVPAPRVVVDPIGADTDITAEAIKALLESGALTADPALEEYLRSRYRLPAAEDPAPAPGGAAGRGRRPFRRAVHASTDGAPADWPGSPYLAALTDYYAPKVAEIIEAALDPETIAATFLTGTARAAADDITRRAAEYAGALNIDDDALADELRSMWGDAYIAGTHAADLQLEPDLIVNARPWDHLVDWDDWTPGHARAAAEVAGIDGGRGLATLLGEANVTITGIEHTTLDAIAGKLAAALDEGWSVDRTGRELRAYLADPARAEKIAQTEMARAMTVATLDVYAEHGITARRWLLSVGACPLCVENEKAGSVALTDRFPHGDPPVHPHCVCALAPDLDVL